MTSWRSGHGIAVVGVGCRLPGCGDVEAFWNLLMEGRHAFGALPANRWSPGTYAHELPKGDTRSYSQAAFLEDVDEDWQRLKLPPLKAQRLHRMEKAAVAAMGEALEDAGINAENPPGARGQIVLAATTLGPDPRTDHGGRIRRFELAAPISEALAVTLPDHQAEVDRWIEILFNQVAPPVEPDSLQATASMIAGRVAHLFDFQGGHLAVDCGMSSSLAAVERAMRLLQLHECDVALVCGISPLITPSSVVTFAQLGLLGETPPRPFTDGAGTLLGEGCVALVLKRQDDVGNGKTYAVIEGLGQAHGTADGSLDRLAGAAASAALNLAGCRAEDVTAVETRALGVPALDALEASGLASVLGGGDGRKRPCGLGSSVANTGFLQGAAGMVGLLKASLALKHGTWPTQPGADQANEPSGVALARETIALESGSRVGVSDAGLGPMAYHAILASPAPQSTPKTRRLPAQQDIALVGAGLIAPQADSLEIFWRHVLSHTDAIGDLPADRFDVDKLIGASPDVGAILKTRLAGVVTLPEPGSAVSDLFKTHSGADPAVLLSLLSAERALQDAQYEDGRWDKQRVAVIMGQLPVRARELQGEARLLFAGRLALTAMAMRELGLPEADVDRVTERARAIYDGRVGPIGPNALASRTGLTCPERVADAWGFRGGVLSLDAACASSLAAVQVGMDLLRCGDVDAVLAGGVAYNLLPEYYIAVSMLGVLSPRGAPPFDVGADGFVPAEGAGMVVLKRRADAEAAGDRIYAILKAMGTSSDGADGAVYAPSVPGYRRAVESALRSAAVDAASVDYVEAHGAGTRRGDQAEIEAYAEVFGARDPATPLVVGTVKSQIGHLSSAAGIVGLIKTALALRHRVIPPSNFSADVHPELPFGRAPLELALEARPWVASPRGPRRAGVSAFGLGGVNHHLIVEEPNPGPEPADVTPALPTRLPTQGARADRFEVELVPISLPSRPAQFRLEHKNVLVVGGNDRVTQTLMAQLQQRGARVRHVDLSSAADADAAERLVSNAAGGPIDGVVDLSTFAPPAPLPSLKELPTVVTQVQLRAFGLLRAVYDRFSAAGPLECFYAAVTSMGGDLGLMGCMGANVLGATLVGWAKGLKQELPNVLAKAVDFDPLTRPEEIASALIAELEDGNPRMEIAYAGRRFGTGLRRANFDDGSPALRMFSPGEVFLFSGGGRGVVFECAHAAARAGVIAVVCGRSALPPPDTDWLHWDDTAFAEYRQREMVRRKREDPSMTPVRFAREFDVKVRQRQVHHNIQRARAANLPLHYEPCNITDAAQVDALVKRVRADHGPIRAIVHGAMVEWSRSLPNKTAEIVERTMATKVGGLCHLVAATRDEPLHTLMCFGSGAGRFGNRGQSDYCAANAQMAALLPALAASHPARPHSVTLDWTAWEEVGAAAATEDMASLVKATGVSAVRPQEGTYWFSSELARGNAQETVIFEERMLHDWPFLGSNGEGEGERAVTVDDRGTPLVPGQWPMVDQVVEAADGRVVFERLLDVDRDMFLSQHRLHGTPIVPATFGCETLAEAAALACPGWRLVEASDIVIDVPVKLHRERPLLLRARASVVRDDGDTRVVETETHSHLYLRGKPLQEDRRHHTGRFVLRRGPAGAPPHVVIPESDGVSRARSFFHLAKDPVMLGPLFCRAEWLQVQGNVVTGTVRAPRQRDILARTSHPIFLVDPLLMDAAFQVAANWDGYLNGHVSIPLGIAGLRLGRRRRRAESARVRAEMVRVVEDDVFYNIDVAGEDGALLMRIEGLQLRRIAQMPDLRKGG